MALGGLAIPGITLTASSTLPSGDAGRYQWVQLINSDQDQAITAAGVRSCTTFTDPAGTPELDSVYPYDLVSTNQQPNDTAQDSPNTELPQTMGEIQCVFNATIYLRCIPTGTVVCSSGSACAIPVPLGSVTWGWAGDAINTLLPQTTVPGQEPTTWVLNQDHTAGCPGTCTFASNPPFQASTTLSAENNFGYLSWQNTVSGQCGLQ
jgi:hypothetical protein